MKFIVVLGFIAAVVAAVYLFLNWVLKIKKIGKINWKAGIPALIIGLILLGLLIFVAYKSANTPDTWCSTTQTATSYPPAAPVTAMDYFEKGNYDYDTGYCKQAVADYTKSISMNFKYPQAFNNRAYTYMRMRDYQNALTDLNKALELNPNYVNALMNRGDVYNYYLNDKAKAIADYKKIISIAGTQGTSVCGHLFLAEHNGWNLGTILEMPFVISDCRSASK